MFTSNSLPSPCSVPSLPGSKHAHSLNVVGGEAVVCGGYPSHQQASTTYYTISIMIKLIVLIILNILIILIILITIWSARPGLQLHLVHHKLTLSLPSGYCSCTSAADSSRSTELDTHLVDTDSMTVILMDFLLH